MPDKTCAVNSALAVVGILASRTGHSRIGPCRDRVIGVAVLGATDATDKMAGNLRHRQSLRQVETAGVDVEMPRRPAIPAVDLQQLPLPDEVANRHGLEVEGLRLAAAPGLVPILL